MNHFKSQIARLVVLAKEDGNIDLEEVKWIYGMAAQWGLSSQEMNDIISDPDTLSYDLPENQDEKMAAFYQMMTLAMADGDMDPDEEKLLLKTGKDMGFESYKLIKVLDQAREGSFKWPGLNKHKDE